MISALSLPNLINSSSLVSRKPLPCKIKKIASSKFDFSARSYYRLIKTARTIADLEGSAKILPLHMAEALQYKQII